MDAMSSGSAETRHQKSPMLEMRRLDLAGLYQAHETNDTMPGMVVQPIITGDAVPNWRVLVREYMASGMSAEGAFGKVKDAAQDGWPGCFAEVCAMLDWCADNGRV